MVRQRGLRANLSQEGRIKRFADWSRRAEVGSLSLPKGEKSPTSPNARPESVTGLGLFVEGLASGDCFEVSGPFTFELPVFQLLRSHPQVRPIFSPFDAIASNPIVRAAREVPVPDGWIQGHGFAIEDKLPIRRCERRYDFTAAATATAMHSSSMHDGHVENASVERVRDGLDKLMVELRH